MELACPECRGNGRGCEACEERGFLLIDRCPMACLDDAVWEAIDVAEWVRRGIPPAPGSYQEQTNCILEALQFIWSDQSRWKKDKKLIDLDG